MHMFFAMVTKTGRPLTAEERAAFVESVRGEVYFYNHITRTYEVAPAACSHVVGVSNEPSGGWLAGEASKVFICGYCAHDDKLLGLEAELDLADRASRIGGRFSVLVVDVPRRRFAMATQPSRIDSIFRAENDEFIFWGSQASVLSILCDGELRYQPRNLVTMIHAGFFW